MIDVKAVNAVAKHVFALTQLFLDKVPDQQQIAQMISEVFSLGASLADLPDGDKKKFLLLVASRVQFLAIQEYVN